MNSPKNTLRTVATHPIENDTQAAHSQALALSAQKAAANARRTAAALGLHLLGPAAQHGEILTDERGRPLEARTTLETPVSAFRQSALDLKLLAVPRKWPTLIKKELASRWFRFQLRLRVSNMSRPLTPPVKPRALVAGHFSLPGGGGTFGDVEALETVCQWLEQAGIPYEAASNGEDGVNGPPLLAVDPTQYSLFIFVCGPWYPRRAIHALLLERFAHCFKIGVNLTVAEPGKAGFDLLLARDNPDEHRADLAFARPVASLPVVGFLLVERQAAYGHRQRHPYVKQVFEEYLASGKVVPLRFDTVIHRNQYGLANAEAFESLLRKVDVLVTNRLHGLVLGLKNKVPVVAVDAVAGGGKVSAQAQALGWPVLIPAEALSIETLHAAVQKCLGPEISSITEAVHRQASASLARTRTEFLEAVSYPPDLKRSTD